MSNLLTSLLNSTGALDVYGRVFDTIQNNITNANTPGYVKQEQSITAARFDPGGGLSGGVVAGKVLSSRSTYLEQAVRNQQQLLGDAEQKASDLGQVEPLFDLTSDYGVPGSLNKFFNSFSQLAVNPNDAVSRQTVIDAAQQVAQSFNQNAAGIGTVIGSVDSQTRSTVADINRIAGNLAAINQQIHADPHASENSGLDAQLNSTLEDLSKIAPITMLPSGDGSVNVYLGGQTPLVIGDHAFAIQADISGASTTIRDSSGADITSQISSGNLGALIIEKNTSLPGYLADLNTLAQSFADTINAGLAAGVNQNGATPATNLFTYDATNPTNSLAVTGITPDQIAAASAGAAGGNGNAIAIARLANVSSVNGMSFTQFYGNIGANVGRDLAAAQQGQSQYQDAVTQAQQQRSEQTGVSIDEEAAKLLQFQQAYQAAGKMVATLESLTQTVLNLIQ